MIIFYIKKRGRILVFLYYEPWIGKLKYKNLDIFLLKLYNDIVKLLLKGGIIQMKQHISIVLVITLLATALVGCGSSDTGLTDGIYTGEGQGMNPLKVSVTVTDGKIADVEVTEHDETPGFYEPALEEIPSAIVDTNSTEVEAVSGATVTSNAIKEAVDNALEQAK